MSIVLGAEEEEEEEEEEVVIYLPDSVKVDESRSWLHTKKS
jgi:hypothetical protein